MRERPIGDLVDGLKQLGADVDCFLGTNCPPVRVVGKGGLPGGKVSIIICNCTFYAAFGGSCYRLLRFLHFALINKKTPSCV